MDISNLPPGHIFSRAARGELADDHPAHAALEVFLAQGAGVEVDASESAEAAPVSASTFFALSQLVGSLDARIDALEAAAESILAEIGAGPPAESQEGESPAPPETAEPRENEFRSSASIDASGAVDPFDFAPEVDAVEEHARAVEETEGTEGA